jgi:hypothetical protein
MIWMPGEEVEETYPLRLKPGAPPGLYQLEVGLLRPDETLPEGYEALAVTGGSMEPGRHFYPLTVRLLDPAHEATPSRSIQAQVGQQIYLTGYDVNPVFSDSPGAVALTLYWRSTTKIPVDYTVFTQLVGPDGQVWAQWDNPPQAGRYPTSAWSQNDRVVDRYKLTFGEGAPQGDYRLLVGMYDPVSGQRLPILVEGQGQPDHALELTTLSFAP